jgi:PhnB protein
MTKAVSYLPEGYSTIVPFLIVNNATKAIEFYKDVFEAKEVMRMEGPNNKVAHAELTIGDSKFMLADECPEMSAKSPIAYGGSAVGMQLYVKDVDAVIEQAVKRGAKLIRAIQNQFYGDRSGMIEDPFGHTWHIATHIEDVSQETLKQRMQKMYQ